MNEAFIWLSGLHFIDKKIINPKGIVTEQYKSFKIFQLPLLSRELGLMARNVFKIFTENIPVRGLRKKYNIPDWLRKN